MVSKRAPKGRFRCATCEGQGVSLDICPTCHGVGLTPVHWKIWDQKLKGGIDASATAHIVSDKKTRCNIKLPEVCFLIEAEAHPKCPTCLESLKFSPSEKYMLFLRGFRDGANATAMRHPGYKEYEEGYSSGRTSRSKAVSAYARKVGFVPQILRTAGE